MAGQPITKNTENITLGKYQIRVGNSAANITSTTPVLTDADSIGAVDATAFSRTVENYEHQSGFPAKTDVIIPISESNTVTITAEEMNPRNFAIASGIDPTVAGTTWEGTAYVSSTALGTTDAGQTITGDADAVAEVYRVIFTTATTYDVYSDTRGQLTGTGDTTASSSFTDGALALFTIPANFFTGTWAADETFKFEMRKEGYDDNTQGIIPLGALKSAEYVRMEAILVAPNKQWSQYIIFPRAQVTQDGDVAPTNDAATTLGMIFTANASGSDVEGGNAVWDGSDSGTLGFVNGVL